MSKKVFIVPHDFTSVGNLALEHAIATARPLNASVHLLHVVSKESQIKESTEKLEEVIKQYSESGVEIVPIVRIGSIFEDIGEYAAEHSAELIFMGTHGAHGWQHITGSHALKVVTSSTVPFIIVQEKTVKTTGYDSIESQYGLKETIVEVLTAIDAILLGTVLLVIGYGLYELFIDTDIDVPMWLRVEDLDDLKSKLIGVVVAIIAVVYVGVFVDSNRADDVISYGVSAGALVAGLALFAFATGKSGKKNKD